MKIWMFAAVVLLSACDGTTPDTPNTLPPAQGREETQGIRNTEAISMPGDAIADRVDHALDAQEQRQKQIEPE